MVNHKTSKSIMLLPSSSMTDASTNSTRKSKAFGMSIESIALLLVTELLQGQCHRRISIDGIALLAIASLSHSITRSNQTTAIRIPKAIDPSDATGTIASTRERANAESRSTAIVLAKTDHVPLAYLDGDNRRGRNNRRWIRRVLDNWNSGDVDDLGDWHDLGEGDRLEDLNWTGEVLDNHFSDGHFLGHRVVESLGDGHFLGNHGRWKGGRRRCRCLCRGHNDGLGHGHFLGISDHLSDGDETSPIFDDDFSHGSILGDGE